MPLESIDLAKRGEWLICVKGPKIVLHSEFHGHYTTRNDNLVGSLMKVVAISPPVLLGFIYDATTKNKIPYLASLHWSEASWSRTNSAYVRNYLRHGGFTLQRKRDSQNELMDSTKHPRVTGGKSKAGPNIGGFTH